ncbi:hypothetical protein CKA32_004287 [Geitlerinema sp. FC II]|nr:hypothetical protein CKA32_004287 [Geitlerinema sp. FC II]
MLGLSSSSPIAYRAIERDIGMVFYFSVYSLARGILTARSQKVLFKSDQTVRFEAIFL